MLQPTMEESYGKVERLIRDICRKFTKQYGGDFDDHFSIANEAFVHAWESFDGRSKFSYWVYRCCRWRLLSALIRRIRNEKRVQCCDPELLESQLVTSDEKDIDDILDGFADDAVIIAQLVIDTPYHLEAMIQGKGGKPQNYRSQIRQHLEDYGWNAERIKEAYSEVTRTLLA